MRLTSSGRGNLFGMGQFVSLVAFGLGQRQFGGSGPSF
jgi:hypothetical protein